MYERQTAIETASPSASRRSVGRSRQMAHREGSTSVFINVCDVSPVFRSFERPKSSLRQKEENKTPPSTSTSCSSVSLSFSSIRPTYRLCNTVLQVLSSIVE